jgi:hypothetical protein
LFIRDELAAVRATHPSQPGLARTVVNSLPEPVPKLVWPTLKQFGKVLLDRPGFLCADHGAK